MSPTTQRTNRLSRDSWLQRALEVVREEGVQNVRVERLARGLGVTKGSFYWHFRDFDELRDSILDYWDARYTDVVVENRRLIDDPDPAAALWSLVVQVCKEGLDKYELAMRSWAEHDARAEERVASVYEKRTKFIRGFFMRLGFGDLDAEVRTRSMLCYLCWAPSMYRGDSHGRRLKLLKMHHQLLTAT